MGNKLLTQIVLLLTSVVIIITYVRPAFEEIAQTQDDIARFRSTIEKSNELNRALENLLSVESSISSSEITRLNTYLPVSIDDVSIMRDIQNIFSLIEVPITSLESLSDDSFVNNESSVEVSRNGVDANQGMSTLMFKDFQLSFFGTYEHIKLIMQGIEINAYPLEVVELDFDAAPDPNQSAEDTGLPPGVMKIDMTLRAFSLPTTS